MLWWIPIAVAGMACLGVLTVVASTAAGRHEGRHVLTDPQEEWDAHVAEYGSMSLTHEQALHHELPWWPAPTVDPAPWKRLPTAAERTELLAGLSPERLRGPEQPHEKPAGTESAGSGHDSGPGEPSSLVALGPVPLWEYRANHPERLPRRVSLPRIDLDGGPTVSGPEGAEGVNAPPVQPSRWLAEQLEIQRAWWAWQMEKARIFA